MWSSFTQFISRHRLLVILISGLFVFVGSGITTFYWANYPGDKTDSIVKQQRTANSQQTSNPAEETTGNDSIPLSVDNWESFKHYDGPRVRMLGIKRSYNNVNFRRGPGIDNSRIATPEGQTLLEPLDRYGDWYRARLPDGRIGWIHRTLVRQLDVPEPSAEKTRSDYPPLKESTKELVPDGFWNHNRVLITDPIVNVRQGPGTQFPRIGRSYQYEHLRLLARQGNWYRIQTVNRDTGWIHQSLAELIIKDKKSQPGTVTLSTPRLRPGPDFQLREQQPSDQSVTAEIIAKNDTWYQVRLENGNIGWVPKSMAEHGSP